MYSASGSQQTKAKRQMKQYKASGSQQTKAKRQMKQYKVFHDSVHGHIKMHPLLVDIIDTPVFQRLRNIKQMGGIYYVFPGASHNRFEHSLGVGHLAGELIRSLKAKGQDISSTDVFCVQIAGLCHDLGHGPFSHLFEGVVKQLSEKSVSETTKALKNWKHEAQSAKMFDLLIENGIKDKMKNGSYEDEDGKDLIFKDEDFEFIRELIRGPSSSDSSTNRHYKGRDKKKAFLYEIVANKATGIDVDKMDYISRDCHYLGMKSNFSHERYMMFARVCKQQKKKFAKEEKEEHICMRDKEAMTMFELFQNRYMLHYKVCQHRVVVAVETMLVDALLEAEAHFKIGDKTISEAVIDPETYLKLTDDILQEIMRSKNPKLTRAREIIRRIEKRELYKFVGGKIFRKKLHHAKNWEAVIKDWLQSIQEDTKYHKWQQWISENSINEGHFIVKPVKLHYGKDKQNPIKFLWFYTKRQQDKAVKLSKNEISYTLPKIFAETKVMLFYKGNGKLPKNPPIKEFWNSVKKAIEYLVKDESSNESGEESSNESGEESSNESGDESSNESGEESSNESGEESSNESGEESSEETGEELSKETSKESNEELREESIKKPNENLSEEN